MFPHIGFFNTTRTQFAYVLYFLFLLMSIYLFPNRPPCNLQRSNSILYLFRNSLICRNQYDCLVLQQLLYGNPHAYNPCCFYKCTLFPYRLFSTPHKNSFSYFLSDTNWLKLILKVSAHFKYLRCIL